MTSWLLLALTPPFLWALVNQCDKFLISKYFNNDRGTGSLILYSSLFGLIVCPLIALYEPNVFNIELSSIPILVGIGVLNAICILIYLYVLSKDDASANMPFYQMVPIWGYALGYLFLGETLTAQQIIGAVLIFIGIATMSIDVEGLNRQHLKIKIALLICGASLLLAFQDVLFKYVAVGENFWISSFWSYAGLSLFGIVTFIFARKYREDFIDSFRTSSLQITGLNFFSEGVTIVANLVFFFTILSAPVVLIQLAGATQPVFVFLIGLFLTLLFPHVVSENMNRRVLYQRIVGICIIVFGGLFL